MTEPTATFIDEMLALEQAKVRKLQIIFGPWWRHYAVPYEMRWTLWAEREFCPYCSNPLGAPPLPSTEEEVERSAHIDHMDPLSRGGEESIRNAVYVCATCNMAKGRRLFSDWLARLPEANRTQARAIYIDKHGNPPEAFRPGRSLPRQPVGRLELGLAESVLKKLFPKPVVIGPPRSFSQKQ
ncbi:MAG TPA: HNH endonuclease signature motif containing protein [Burkholderiaceae bacterium]|nr:HNH endonuclease signature motif containing protein [Burkholderiaceae bacterium]